MDFFERNVYNADHEQFRAAFRSWLDKEVVPHHEHWEKDGIAPREIWLEVGFGAGEHLVWQAEQHPDVGLIGCEPYINGVAKCLAHVERVFGEMQSSDRGIVRGDDAASIYQTYGLPPELFEQMAAEKNYTFDWSGFRDAMGRHGDASGSDQFVIFKTGPIEALKRALHQTTFLGYETTEAEVEITDQDGKFYVLESSLDVSDKNADVLVGEEEGRVQQTVEMTHQLPR